MQAKKLGLIHTSATLVARFQSLCQELLPSVEVFNIVDDSLIRDVIATGQLTPSVSKRLACHVQCAEAAGADAIMVTCSSVGAAVDAVQPFSAVPVLRVDRPMANFAVSQSARIGVVATLSTTLNPTEQLLQGCAQALGKDVEVTSRLCEGAFEALMQGEIADHDSMVADQIANLSQTVDLIVLAQASMERIVNESFGATIGKPILASPRIGVESLVQVLA